MYRQSKSFVIVLLLALAMSATGVAEELVLKDDKVTVKLGPEVAAAEEKVKAIKEYRIMERLQEELRHRMAVLPGTSKAQIVITRMRLRSGRSVFFGGGMTGDDFIETEITITDRGKQTHRMVLESVNTRSSRSASRWLLQSSRSHSSLIHSWVS